MGSVRVKMHGTGCKFLMRSEEVESLVRERGERVRDAANAACNPDKPKVMENQPYDCEVRKHKDRAFASVSTATPHGTRDNAKNNRLLKSLDAARG